MRIPKKYQRCCYCKHYFVNVNWEKLCVDTVVDDKGKKRIKVKEKLGIMGDRFTCLRGDKFTPSDSLIKLLQVKAEERKAKRKSRAK